MVRSPKHDLVHDKFQNFGKKILYLVNDVQLKVIDCVS